jgi:pimeloyl-ACP methyl ester carboxylesterase
LKARTAHRTIVFSHANSFPASTYRTLFEGWRAAGYEVHAIDKLGHDARYPVTNNWPFLVEQLRDFVEHEVGRPAYLVGHSLGGYLSMMVASRYPHLAQGVVVMDSPLLPGWQSAGIALAKKAGAMQRVMPSRISAQRTQEWPSLQAARVHFGSKPKFAAFHPGILGDYLHDGTQDHADGGARSRRLSFSREVETAIYNTMPHALLQRFRRHPHQCPVSFIGGTRSSELRKVGLSGIKQVVGERLSWIEGTHLYPFEQPQATVAEVLRWLQQFEQGADLA